MPWDNLTTQEQAEYITIWISNGIPESVGISNYNEANP